MTAPTSPVLRAPVGPGVAHTHVWYRAEQPDPTWRGWICILCAYTFAVKVAE